MFPQDPLGTWTKVCNTPVACTEQASLVVSQFNRLSSLKYDRYTEHTPSRFRKDENEVIEDNTVIGAARAK